MAKGFSRQYPKGRISGDDDGQLTFGIAADHEHKRVLVNFFKPIEWFGLDFETGLQLLMGLAKNLSEISDNVVTVTVQTPEEIAQLKSMKSIYIEGQCYGESFVN